MPTFIKTGFWEKGTKGYNGWLNLELLIASLGGSQDLQSVLNIGTEAYFEGINSYIKLGTGSPNFRHFEAGMSDGGTTISRIHSYPGVVTLEAESTAGTTYVNITAGMYEIEQSVGAFSTTLRFGATPVSNTILLFPVKPNNGIYTLATIQDLEVTPAAGTVITFDILNRYNSVATPGTGNITGNLTGAKEGVIQKIYHNNAVAPTFPGTWVKLGTTSYVTSTLNIIYAEWSGQGTRVEYWITQ